MTDQYTVLARNLRKNMTKEERRLWFDFLKGLNVPVKRQFVIVPYVVDFYIHSAHLIIELDGSQHYEKAGHQKDSERDQILKEKGYSVLRYANNEVNQYFQGVCEDILQHINATSSESLPLGEGGTAGTSRDG